MLLAIISPFQKNLKQQSAILVLMELFSCVSNSKLAAENDFTFSDSLKVEVLFEERCEGTRSDVKSNFSIRKRDILILKNKKRNINHDKLHNNRYTII